MLQQGWTLLALLTPVEREKQFRLECVLSSNNHPWAWGSLAVTEAPLSTSGKGTAYLIATVRLWYHRDSSSWSVDMSSSFSWGKDS